MKHLQLYLFTVIILIFTFSSVIAQSHRDTVNVHHYNLNLDMTQSLSGIISGNAELTLSLLAPTNTFALDLYKLTTDSILLNGKSISYHSNDSTIRIFQATNFDVDTFRIIVYYHGQPKKDPQWGGFFNDGNMAYNIGVGMGSYPHGIGRFWYPCNDAFTDRATYDFHIITRNTEKAVASGILINDSIYNNKNYFHWKLNQTIPTYLSSIVVGPFISINDTYSGIEADIPIEIFTLKKDSAAAIVTFNRLKESLAAFEKRFGPYQWDKVGYSVLSFGQGAMEHVNNIAYPQNQLNDNMGARTLVAHELAHNWFGNLVTCSSSTDMWLNEGWASYCESIFKEEVYNPQAGLSHTLNNHLSVIKTAHLADGGYFALNDISPNITYGSTVYDKGAVVVHCLRGYLGDELFFASVKEFLNQNQYSSISSEYLESELSKISGVDLSPFFKNWVYQAGFPHYSVNYFESEADGELFNVELELRQKLKARSQFSNSNRIPLRFIDNNYRFIDTVISFNDETQLFNLKLPINPVAIFTDINHAVLDAITDDVQTIKETGYTTFTNCDFKLKTNKINDSALIRVQYNWLPADDFSTPAQGINISNYHYWKIEGLFSPDMDCEGKFSYNFSTSTNGNSDYNPSNNDTLVLLYRADAKENWRVIEKGERASIKTGYIWTNYIKLGEYALAYWDGESPIGINNRLNNFSPTIYPNPFTDQFTISMPNPFNGSITISNMEGKILVSKTFFDNSEINMETKDLPKGVFIINTKGSVYSSTMAIKI